jgi:predicted RNA-binding Zn ribbon-like protein
VGIHANTLDIIGGELCLAFTDTVDWRKSDHPQELLTSYPDLVSWGRDVGALIGAEADRLLQQAEQGPAEAAAVLERAIVLRETIYQIFEAVADDRSPALVDLDVLNGALSETLARLRLVTTPEGLAWDWTDPDYALDRMLWPVVRLAAELLTRGDWTGWANAPPAAGCSWITAEITAAVGAPWRCAAIAPRPVGTTSGQRNRPPPPHLI